MLDDWSDFEYVCDELHPGNYLSVEFFFGNFFCRDDFQSG
jgi:hypothetical protein